MRHVARRGRLEAASRAGVDDLEARAHGADRV
jgi:hypothetical protein